MQKRFSSIGGRTSSFDKGGISALRLSKHIGVSWQTPRSMLKKSRTAMSHRDSLYRLLHEMIDFDDTCVGGKKPVLVKVELRNKTGIYRQEGPGNCFR